MYGFKPFLTPESITSTSKSNSSCYFGVYYRMLKYVLTFKWNLFSSTFKC